MSKSFLAVVALVSGISLAGQTSDVKTATSSPVPLKVTILGSGGGPPVDLERYGPSILVQSANGDKLLFDCGRVGDTSTTFGPKLDPSQTTTLKK